MARIDLEALAKEYGLHVERVNVGRHTLWKEAGVCVFIDRTHTGGCAMLWAVYPPAGHKPMRVIDSCISMWSDLRCENDHNSGIPKWHKHEVLANDTFNEPAIRKTIENTIAQYNEWRNGIILEETPR